MTTCRACQHENDDDGEFYYQDGPGGGGMFCRNHNMCHKRTKERRKLEYIRQFGQPKETSMSRFGTYTEPANDGAGSDYKPRDHYGNSAIVHVREYRPEMQTVNGVGRAVICDVHDLNMKETHLGVLMMTGSLVDAFEPHVGKAPVVVRWEKRTANNGRPYATAVPAVEAALTAAEDLYSKHGDPFIKGTTDGAAEEVPF